MKLHEILYASYLKWKVLGYLGVRKKKRLKHLAVTDTSALEYWKKVYHQIKKP